MGEMEDLSDVLGVVVLDLDLPIAYARGAQHILEAGGHLRFVYEREHDRTRGERYGRAHEKIRRPS